MSRFIEVDDSDWVAAIGYDVDTSVLSLKTLKGPTYAYDNVPAITFARVVLADSVGTAVNKELRGLKYTVTKR